ncbi:MAG: two-component system response regulator FlrC [Myxococcota bacterium]|jgi:two-component system response regulator FlrC
MSGGLSVLVVDDNRSAALAIAMLLEREGHTAEAVYDGQTAIARLGGGSYDLVLTDLRMEPVDGLAVVAAARRQDPPVEAIVFTAYGSVDAAVEAMRLGAADFLTKPVTADVILRRVRNLRSDTTPTDDELVGESAATAQLREQARKLVQVRSTVLLTGEIGTGRRHLARWLHHHGLDADRPLVTARPNRPLDVSQLDEAGTLLIPGVDDWEHSAQSLLQQQLESLEPGSPPRVIATASGEINDRVAAGEFRPDLYFRLAVLVVPVTALRARPEDIAPLLASFLDQHALRTDTPPVRPTPAQLRHLCGHGWPGNIRELANLAERAAVLGDLAFEMPVRPAEPTQATPVLQPGFNLSSHMDDMERLLLVQAIEQTGGDRPKMSRILGLERNTLRYKLNKYKLLKK